MNSLFGVFIPLLALNIRSVVLKQENNTRHFYRIGVMQEILTIAAVRASAKPLLGVDCHGHRLAHAAMGSRHRC